MFTALYNSFLCISRPLRDVKRKHRKEAPRTGLVHQIRCWGGSGQLSGHKMNFTFQTSKIHIQTYMFNHIHTLFFEIVLAPKVSPTIEMMNKWGSEVTVWLAQSYQIAFRNIYRWKTGDGVSVADMRGQIMDRYLHDMFRYFFASPAAIYVYAYIYILYIIIEDIGFWKGHWKFVQI